jgi:uncharacterized protein
MQLDALVQNLASPPLLFFFLGLFATRVRSDLAIPEQVGKALSLYLILAIGFKGGVQLRVDGIGADVVVGVAVAIALSASLPLLAYALLRSFTRVGPVDAAAVAAHYGSVSVVTFLAAQAFLDLLDVTSEAYMVTLLAIMEAPGIIVGIVLARRALVSVGGRSDSAGGEGYGSILRESFTNGSLLLLLGALLIGTVSGPGGLEQVEGFISTPFTGVLMLFLLDMGIVAGRRLGDVRTLGPSVVLFGIGMALLGGSIGVVVGSAVGLSVGGATLLGVLSGSASYIAAPATIRLAVPEANPSLYLTLSLGVTFPFNIVAGIPAYYGLAQLIAGG